MKVPVPYSCDIDHVTSLLLKAAKKVKNETEVGHSVRGKPEVWGVEEMTGEYLTMRIAMRTAPLQQWDVARVLRVYVKSALDREGLHIPLQNQSVVHGTQTMPIISARSNGPTASSPATTSETSSQNDSSSN